MEHQEFVDGYRSGVVAAHVDPSRAMHVCDRPTLMPGRYRAAHHFWKIVAVLLALAGLLSLFWVRWWVGVAMLISGLVLMPAVQRSAAGFVLEHALEDSAFYKQMVDAGVLRATKAAQTAEDS